MHSKFFLLGIAVLAAVSGCGTTSSSNATSKAPSQAWEGTVFVSQATIPDGITYKVLGSVQADAKVGYDSVDKLYPLLAIEAKKIGANAVVNAKGGRRVTAFSWAAAYVDGIAVKVEDPGKLKGMAGSNY